MPAELTEQSTPDDIQSYVDAVVSEVEQERSGEKDDARLAVEHADNEHKEPKEPPKTPALAKAKKGSDSAPKGETKTSKEEAGSSLPEWIDDDVKSEASAYGIKESELSDFTNREELDRALRLFDKSALEAGRKKMAEDEPSKAEPKPEKAEAKADEKPEPKKDDQPKSGRYEVTLDEDLYDDGLVAEFGRMRDHYESRLEALEARLNEADERFYEADARAEEQQFDNFVDSLGHEDLFGKTHKEDEEQLQRRQDLMVAVKAQQIGLEQLGRPTDMSESLVSRVARMVFADELAKKDIKTRTRKISKQHNSRQGGGVTRPQDPRDDPRDEADRLYRELAGQL